MSRFCEQMMFILATFSKTQKENRSARVVAAKFVIKAFSFFDSRDEFSKNNRWTKSKGKQFSLTQVNHNQFYNWILYLRLTIFFLLSCSVGGSSSSVTLGSSKWDINMQLRMGIRIVLTYIIIKNYFKALLKTQDRYDRV